jgi:hypothetical protein
VIKLKCAGCKKAEGITVVCSMFGATSFALCDECLRAGREDYRNMVNYISCAGRWPQDINDIYQEEVRRQLKLHDKTEAEFAADVDEEIKRDLEFQESYYASWVQEDKNGF